MEKSSASPRELTPEDGRGDELAEALAEDERRQGRPHTDGEWRAFVEGFRAESFRLKSWKIG